VSDTQQACDSGNNRTMAIVAYVLYLVGLPTLHLATIAGLILAYVQRDEARGTVWQSHFDAIISTFWISLAVGIVAGILCLVGIGFVMLGILVLWFLYRSIRGLIHAIDSKPY
jgi:uncharacterized membrane protein